MHRCNESRTIILILGQHFSISAKISNSKASREHGGEVGQLWFVLHATSDGTGRTSSRIPLNEGGYHEPNITYTYVVPAQFGDYDIRAVEVELQYNSMVFNPLTWRLLTVPMMYVEQIDVVALETDKK